MPPKNFKELGAAAAASPQDLKLNYDAKSMEDLISEAKLAYGNAITSKKITDSKLKNILSQAGIKQSEAVDFFKSILNHQSPDAEENFNRALDIVAAKEKANRETLKFQGYKLVRESEPIEIKGVEKATFVRPQERKLSPDDQRKANDNFKEELAKAEVRLAGMSEDDLLAVPQEPRSVPNRSSQTAEQIYENSVSKPAIYFYRSILRAKKLLELDEAQKDVLSPEAQKLIQYVIDGEKGWSSENNYDFEETKELAKARLSSDKYNDMARKIFSGHKHYIHAKNCCREEAIKDSIIEIAKMLGKSDEAAESIYGSYVDAQKLKAQKLEEYKAKSMPPKAISQDSLKAENDEVDTKDEAIETFQQNQKLLESFNVNAKIQSESSAGHGAAAATAYDSLYDKQEDGVRCSGENADHNGDF